jgi:hypothetical protein
MSAFPIAANCIRDARHDCRSLALLRPELGCAPAGTRSPLCIPFAYGGP